MDNFLPLCDRGVGHRRRSILTQIQTHLKWHEKPVGCMESNDEMLDLEIPYAISLDALKEVLAGWYRAQAHRQAVTTESVAKTVKYKPRTVQRQNKFLGQIGVITPSRFSEPGSRVYSLTAKGEVLARSADYEQKDEFESVLADLIVNWEEFDTILEYIQEAPEVSRDSLAKRIMMVSDRPSSDKNAMMGSACLIDLLGSIGFITIEDDVVTPTKLLQEKTIDGLHFGTLEGFSFVDSSFSGACFLVLLVFFQ